MTDGVFLDTHEIYTLAADLASVPIDSGPRIRQAVEISSRNVKDAWKAKLQGTPRLPYSPGTITYDIEGDYDTKGNASELRSEIGSVTGRKQATFVTVIEFGAPSNNLPPHGYGAAALQEEQDDFEKGLDLAIAEPLEMVGLA